MERSGPADKFLYRWFQFVGHLQSHRDWLNERVARPRYSLSAPFVHFHIHDSGTSTQFYSRCAELVQWAVEKRFEFRIERTNATHYRTKLPDESVNMIEARVSKFVINLIPLYRSR